MSNIFVLFSGGMAIILQFVSVYAVFIMSEVFVVSTKESQHLIMA